MKTQLCALAVTLLAQSPAWSGGLPDAVFGSGFEAEEACAVHDGFADIISIPVIAVTGDFLLNGVAFPANEFDDAVISLRHRDTGDVFQLGETDNISYSINLVPGRYDVLYSVQSPGTTVPRNVDAVVQEDVLLFESGSFDINVSSYLIGGSMQLNGAAFPAQEYDDGVIFLESAGGGSFQLAETKDLTFADVPVLPGQYNVRYQVQSPGDTVPVNTWGRAGVINVAGNDPGININVSSVAISGSFRHNGVLMPAVEYDDGNFYLETDQGDRLLLGNSHDQTFTKNVIPGKYHIYWERESAGATMPFNARARLQSNVTVAAGNFDIDMVSHVVSGEYLQNGAAFTNDVAHTAQIVLRDVADGEELAIGHTHEGSYSHRLVANTYDVVYKYVQGTEVPGNLVAVVDRMNVKSSATFDVAVTAANIAAQVYLDGNPFPADNAQLGFIFLQGATTENRLLVGITPQQDLTARALVGTYDVYYSYQAGNLIPKNRNALIQSAAVVDESVPWPPLDGGLQLALQSQILNGSFRLNDAPTPADDFDDGLVELRIGSDWVEFGNTHDQSYSTRLIRLDENTIYPMHYGRETTGASMPVNGDAPVQCLLYQAPFL